MLTCQPSLMKHVNIYQYVLSEVPKAFVDRDNVLLFEEKTFSTLNLC